MIKEKKLFTSVRDAQHACASYLASCILSADDCLFLYSGGSALTILPFFIHRLARQHALVFAPVDERFDEKASNYVSFASTQKEVMEEVLHQGGSFIDTSPHERDQYEMAIWYEKRLTTQINKMKERKGKIIALLGMGEDGHTAGILPYPTEEKIFYEQFLDTNRLVVGYDATGKNEHTKRYTLTYPGLHYADEYVLFTTGAKKHEVLNTIEATTPSLHQYPAAFLYYSDTPCTIISSVQL